MAKPAANRRAGGGRNRNRLERNVPQPGEPLAGNSGTTPPRAALFNRRSRTWPVRLRPHEKAIFYSTDGVLLPPPVWANPYAYAKTDCGQSVYGKSSVLEHVAANKSLQS